MKLVTTLKIVNLPLDPVLFEDGEIYFNSETNRIRVSYDGLWSDLIDGDNLELSFARRVSGIEDLEQNGSYLIVSADQNAILLSTSASHVNFIIPSNSTQYIDIGTSIKVVRAGSGSVDFSEEYGVVLRKADENYLNSTWTSLELIKINTNEWLLDGEFPDLY